MVFVGGGSTAKLPDSDVPLLSCIQFNVCASRCSSFHWPVQSSGDSVQFKVGIPFPHEVAEMQVQVQVKVMDGQQPAASSKGSSTSGNSSFFTIFFTSRS